MMGLEITKKKILKMKNHIMLFIILKLRTQTESLELSI